MRLVGRSETRERRRGDGGWGGGQGGRGVGDAKIRERVFFIASWQHAKCVSRTDLLGLFFFFFFVLFVFVLRVVTLR